MLELKDIQGLVTSGYGHMQEGHYLFLQFNDAAKGRNWLNTIIPQVSNGDYWQKDLEGNTIKPDYMLNLAFTHAGLHALDLPSESLNSFPHEFQQGMAHPDRSHILGDFGENAPENWQFGADDRIHALIVILTISTEVYTPIHDNLTATFAAHDIVLVHHEMADKLPNNKEHFGFFDGISQPKLEDGVRKSKSSEPTIEPGEFVLGYKNEYGQIPVAPTLNGQDFGKNSTYLVFRKLEQDVALFWQFVQNHTPEIEGDSPEAKMSQEERAVYLASKMVGRWPSGVPLVMSPDKDDPSISFEEWTTFMFHDRDPHGYQCPFGSHIRRMNPRDSLPPSKTESLKTADRHQLIRRGMTYGSPLIDFSQLPPKNPENDGQERGLMFLCVNANISRQFEFVQQTWVENTKFHALYNDKDPLIGACNGETDLTIQQEPVRQKVKNLPRFVTMKGGAYFFLPSISALKKIAAL